MTDFTPIVVGDPRTQSIDVARVDTKFTDIDTMMARIAACFASQNPLNPSGPVDPDTNLSSGIPMRFKTVTDEDGNTQIVQASVTSTAALQQDLEGLTFTAGEAFIARTSNPDAFGTSVGRGDALMAKVNSPTQDIDNTTDWLRLEGDDSYSITLSERQWINTLTEVDTAVRTVDVSDETTVTFYLLNAAATVDGDLTGGQTDSFVQNADQRQGIAYVRLSSLYVPNAGEDNVYFEIVDPGGGVSTFVPLSTFTERTDLLVDGDDVFESAGFAHGASINYAAGQTIRLWRTRTSRSWFFRESFDVLRGLNNNVIPIEKLTPSVQEQIRGHGQQTADIASLLSRVNTLWPLAIDVNVLDALAAIFIPEQASETVNIVPPYTRIADFRGTASTDHY